MNPEDEELADAIFGLSDNPNFDVDAIAFVAIYLTELLVQHSVDKDAATQALLEIALAVESDLEQHFDSQANVTIH